MLNILLKLYAVIVILIGVYSVNYGDLVGPRSGRVLAVVTLFASCIFFSDKFSKNKFAEPFILIAGFLGLTLMLFVLYN